MKSKSLQVFSNSDVNVYSSQLADKIELGYEIVNAGMSMSSIGPVWWAIMTRDLTSQR